MIRGRAKRGAQRAWYVIQMDAWRVVDLAAHIGWWVPCGSSWSELALYKCGAGWTDVGFGETREEFMRA